METTTNYTIAEDFILPSGGKIYEEQFDPHIKLKSMTIRDEMKRTSQTSMPHKNLCEIIDNCLLTKLPYSCYDLCVGDYEYLLHKLRVVTYGPDYKMVVGCPHCTNVYEATVNLDDLKIKEFKPEELKECLNITLPVSKKQIELRLQTPRMLDAIDAKVKEMKSKDKVTYDPTALVTLQQCIVLVDGMKLSYIEQENFINQLGARDATFILSKITKATQMIGLDTSLDVTCSSCGGDIKTYFRFGSEFFRPTED